LDLTPNPPILTTDVFVDSSTTTGIITLKPAASTPVGGARLVDQRARHAGPLGAAPLDARRAPHRAPAPPRGGARNEDPRAPHAALNGAALCDDRRARDTDPLAGAPRDDWRARLTTQGVGRRGNLSTTTGARTALGRCHPRPRAPTGTPARASRGQPVGQTPPVADLPRGGRRRTRCATVWRSGAASHRPSLTAGTRTSGR